VKRSVTAIATLVFAIFAAHAASGGSAYSRYGVGDIRYFPSARAVGMGGVNLAIVGIDELNRINPAAWTQVKQTMFSGTFLYEGYSTSDGANSVYRARGDFGGAMLALPVSPSHGIVFGGGFAPYSRVNYDITTTGTQLGVDYTAEYGGSGGLSHAFFGFSYQPTSALHLGVQTQYLFGPIENDVTITFGSATFSNSVTRRRTDYRGFQFTIGTIYTDVGKWIGISDRHRLSVGALFTTPLNATVERSAITSVTSFVDTLAETKGTAHIPARIGLGAALTLNSRYLIATDVVFQNWERFEEFASNPKEIRNWVRWSIGAERLPAAQPSSFGERVAYRLGFVYNSSYYRLKDEPLYEVLFSGGVGFPVGSRSRVNFALGYGFRGTTDKQLQKDNIFRLMVTVNLGELWFIRPPVE